MTIRFLPLDQAFVDGVRSGGPDAYGRPAERAVSDGKGVPCRSCLGDVPEGEAYLVVAARPFPQAQPYAETGPVFLCARPCTPWGAMGVPPMLTTSPDYIVRGYTADHRISYGTGQVTPAGDVADYAARLLEEPAIAHVDIRSARNNCFQTRAVRA